MRKRIQKRTKDKPKHSGYNTETLKDKIFLEEFAIESGLWDRRCTILKAELRKPPRGMAVNRSVSDGI